MSLHKVEVTKKVSLLYDDDNKDFSKDYIEIFDDFNGPVVYDEHTGTFDIAVEDIQKAIDYIIETKDKVMTEYMKRGIL